MSLYHTENTKHFVLVLQHFVLVLQYCQIHSVAAALFVCYTESSHLDSRSVEAFKFLLKMSPLNALPQVK